jgi:metallo-beta-lactamase family protein
MASILFAGAAGEVTGSRHLLKLPQGTLLLDCGMFQGRREESRAKSEKFLFDPAKVDAVVLSHAHIDHCGTLPLLVKRGFKGRIYATPATCQLADLLLRDSARIQESDAYFYNKRHSDRITPMFGEGDVDECKGRFEPREIGLAFEPLPGVKAYFHEAGHILGSAIITLKWEEAGRTRRLLFSGDLGRAGTVLLRDPWTPVTAPDVLLLESTYGAREHGPTTDIDASLREVAAPVLQARGKVLVPSFAVGRTQELIYHLAGLMDQRAIPKVPIFVDSPLAEAATKLFSLHRELMDAGFHEQWRGKDPFKHAQVHFTSSKEESQAINAHAGPAIILAASGMCENGRILHHLKQHLD